MAEAAVATPGGRFFCHKCTQEINPVLPEFTCPRCQSGFIEELETQGALDSPGEYPDDDFPHRNFEILGYLDNSAQNDLDTREGPSQGNRQAPFAPTRVSVRRRAYNAAPLEGLIQQIMVNLTGGAGLAGNAGIPIFFNLHSNPGDYAWGRGGLDAIITQLLNQLDCTGPPPLSKDKITQIPMVKIVQEQVDKTLQCTVCMEDFKVDESVRLLPCQHHFHDECIVPWLDLHGTCPICRKSLNDEEVGGGGGGGGGVGGGGGGGSGPWGGGGGGGGGPRPAGGSNDFGGRSASSTSNSSAAYNYNDDFD